MTEIPGGKVAIITGASSGIGRATALALHAAGWSVTLTARRREALEETANLCDGGSNDRCLVVPGNITDEQFVETLFESTITHFGRLDLLFNNAGIGNPQIPLEDLPLSVFHDVLETNVVAPFLCTRYAFKIFKRQSPRGGRIINNGSISAQVPRLYSSPYTASKHAIQGLTKSTALDGRAFNITCTQIDIGNAHTDMAASHEQGALQPNGKIVSEGTFDVKHVADAVAHIASLPLNVTVLTMNIMATGMPFVGRG